MRAACRASQGALLAALAVAACRPSGEPRAGLSVSRAGEGGGAAPSSSGKKASRPRLEGWDAIRSWPAVSPAFVSQGHAAGRYVAEVKVSPEARARYIELVAGALLPVGSVVAKIHRDRATGEPGPVFAMHKVGPDRWEFTQAEPDGTVVADSRADLCARCHADGVSDHLFGIPSRGKAGRDEATPATDVRPPADEP